MALLDQLFRLRGAPRAEHPPVTLGDALAALERREASAASALPQSAGEPEPPQPQPPVPAPISPPEPPRPAPAPEPRPDRPPEPASAREDRESRVPETQPPASPRSRGTRFNPFAPAEEDQQGLPGSNERTSAAVQLGPCLEDPTLPPLRLKPHEEAGASGAPVVLGGVLPDQTNGAGETEAALRQVEAPAIRLVPVKLPAPAVQPSAPAASKPMHLRLEIQAEPSLDVVAFKQYAAKFPGVVKCVISDGRG